MNTHNNTLEILRKEIDRVDEQLLQILAERLNVAKLIGEYKRVNNIPVLQNSRWQELLKNRLSAGNDKGLDTDFLHEMFTLIHHESIEVQQKLLSK